MVAGQRQAHDRPCGASLGDPLIVAKGEAALEVRLDLHRAALHVPRPILSLRAKEELHSTLHGSVRGRHPERAQRVEDLPGGIGVAGQVRRLRPAAVLALQREELAGARVPERRVRVRPLQLLTSPYIAIFWKLYNIDNIANICIMYLSWTLSRTRIRPGQEHRLPSSWAATSFAKPPGSP